MAYIILREKGKEIPVEGVVTLEKKLGPYKATLDIWEGLDEELGPHAYKVGEHALNIIRSFHPIELLGFSLDTEVNNLLTLSPEALGAGGIVINFAGEEIKVLLAP